MNPASDALTDFRTPSLVGSSSEDSPSLTGWGIASASGQQETDMQLYEKLRMAHEPPSYWTDLIPTEAERVFALGLCQWIRNDIHGLWMPPESKDGHSPEGMAEVIADRFAMLSHVYQCKGTDSPIEAMMAGALAWLNCDWCGFPELSWSGTPASHWEDAGKTDRPKAYVATQSKIGDYTVDFLVWVSVGDFASGVVIECDGHQYHEKTKEQAARDKKRDRALLAAGFPVARFTGSEIFKDPIGCRDQVAELLSDAIYQTGKVAGYY